jgi:hypothetical protein
MKIKFILLASIILVSFSTILLSQTINIVSTEIEFEKQLRPCLSAELDPEPTLVKKQWSKFLDKNYSIDVSGIGWFSNKDILTASDVTLGSVSDKRMNLYTRILETANGSEMKLFASFGYDFFIGKDNYPAEFEKLKTLMNNFLMQFLTEYYKDKIEETSKAITKNSKEKVSLLKSIEKNKGKIEDAKNEIAKLNAKKSENSEESIKILEKINKLTKEQMDLENENNQALLEIQNLDKKVEVLKLELDKLQQRQNGLIIK